jgi:hypothetical protein
MSSDLIQETFHSRVAKDGCQLVGRRHERRRPVRKIRLEILVGSAVMRYVSMRVDESRREIESPRVENFCTIASRMFGIRSHIADSSI